MAERPATTTSGPESLPVGRAHWPALLAEAIREVFSLMLNSAVEPTTVPEVMPKAQLTAVVGLAGELRGVCVLRCMPVVAGLMASKMLELEGEEAGEKKWDAIGEVCNMVAGNFKNKLPGISERCLLSCPTVIAGTDYQWRSMAKKQALVSAVLFEGNLVVVILEIHD